MNIVRSIIGVLFAFLLFWTIGAAALSVMPLVKGSASRFIKNKNNTILNTALKYQGLEENHNRKELRKLLGVDPVTTSWCAAFANEILSENHIKGTNSLLAKSFLTWGHSVKNPQKGDIVVLDEGGWHGHVGFYVSSDNESVTILAGNTHNKVMVQSYKIQYVMDYRRAN